MKRAAANPVGSAEYHRMCASYWEPAWYAAYTRANHEKRVAEHLAQRSLEHYLPLYGSVRRWRDRRVKLELPLFPGYVFVRLALRDRSKIEQIPGVARLVGFNGTPLALPAEEMAGLKRGLAQGLLVEPRPYMTAGSHVTIKNGPLAGLEGILLRWKRNWRVVISLDLIQRSVAVDLDAFDLEPA